jgi:MarR family transcriptional regulator, organic hydroperoxide resistance regulator
MIEKKLDRAIRDFVWNIVDIHSQLEEINKSWAELLGISEPQWLILMAIADLDDGSGVAGVDVANKLRIHPAFVTNQTKIMEKSGFLAREPSADDARFVLMSLTEKARSAIANLAKERQTVNLTMFDDNDGRSLADLNVVLRSIAKNAQFAAQKLAIDIAHRTDHPQNGEA